MPIRSLRSVAAALRPCLPLSAVPLALLLISCGGSTGTTVSGTTTTTTTNAYAAAFQKATWASGVTVSFPSACSMTVTSSGTPPAHNAYYLGPASGSSTAVATSPSGIKLAVVPYAGGGISAVTAVSGTFNICPTKASSTTATSGGAIGVISSGEVIFSPYEATSTVALSDNVSYTFTSGGTTYIASFLDQCNSHPTNGMNSSTSTWHYHGNPVCWTPTVDGAIGASHIIGIALDGYPIYGGRDANGKIVDATTLDSCNGITSATPEFPSGAYHYVLPIDANANALTTKQSSITCYTGTVSATLSAQMQKLACKMPFLLANGNMRLPDGREVSLAEGNAWMRQTMPGMQMADSAANPATPPRRQTGVDASGRGIPEACRPTALQMQWKSPGFPGLLRVCCASFDRPAQSL